MGLKISSGNMYEFITDTFNIVKGKCYHDCSYCYMKYLNPSQKEAYLDDKELKTDLLKDKFIFLGSGIDLFAENISSKWIRENLNKCYDANNNLFGDENKYFFQSKNPRRFLEFTDHPVFKSSVLCTTIESNIWYPEHMRKSPSIENRVSAMEEIAMKGFETYVTAEPIMKFDLPEMVECMRRCNPKQVNIGRESFRRIEIPEPSNEEVNELAKELAKFTDVLVKKNAIEKGTKDEFYNKDSK